ncbi:PilZ domain-containing protein [Lachnospiraceae bacterium 29-84]
MPEKRRSHRILLQASQITLQICDFYLQDAFETLTYDHSIELTNISEHGIGFISKSIFPLHSRFHACLNLGNETEYLILIHIVRCSYLPHDRYEYGCEFIALEHMLQDSLRQYVSSSETASLCNT